MINEEFMQEFIEEAFANLEDYETALLKLFKGDHNSELLNSAFRAVHSIKGTAGFFALSNIVKLAHTMENLLGEIRDGKRPMSILAIEKCLFGCDVLRQLVADASNSNDVDITDTISGILNMDADIPSQEQLKHDPTPQPINDEPIVLSTPFPGVDLFVDLDELEAIDSSLPFNNVEMTDDVDTFEENQSELNHDKSAKPVSNEPKAVQTTEESVRVNVALLNTLLDLAGEMVLARNQLLKTLESVQKTIPGLQGVLQNIDSITTELQEQIMRTRMQPVSRVFNKFPRILRELARMTKKEVHLELDGSDVELDKSLIEALVDPLTHLVRNAVDHGVELPDERLIAGKGKIGHLKMKAYHEGDHVSIDITDDGRGIDVVKIKQKAISKGLIRQAEAVHMTEDDILQLIFFPGFSTAAEVSDISGRGVGMDVVKTNIEKMGGTINIFTKVGKGTTFRLNLPLTLAIIPSLIVGVQGQKFVLPQVYLQEMLRIKKNDTSRKLEKVKQAWMLRLRGKLLPIIHLADVLGIRHQSLEKDEKVHRVLVLNLGTRQFGLVVDQIFQREEILVKPLPKYLRFFKCYFGVTIQGDGKTAMILDPEGICNTAKLRFHEQAEADKNIVEEVKLDQQNILICSAGNSGKFGIDLAQVSRVEKIKSSAIEHIGGEEVISYRGDLLKVIRPDVLYPIGLPNQLPDHVYMVLPKFVSCPTGILMTNIHDTIVSTVQFTSDPHQHRGMVGTAILRNDPIQMIDLLSFMKHVQPERTSMPEISEFAYGKKILMVEDTPYYSRILSTHLKEAGFKVQLESDGKRALKKWNSETFDAIICDDLLPGINGIELLRESKERDRNGTTFRMLISMRMNAQITEECHQIGGIQTLYKGNWEHLFGFLNQWFELRAGVNHAR